MDFVVSLLGLLVFVTVDPLLLLPALVAGLLIPARRIAVAVACLAALARTVWGLAEVPAFQEHLWLPAAVLGARLAAALVLALLGGWLRRRLFGARPAGLSN